ncbi:unnamed protein product [Sphagnum troendelagicum]
MTLQNKLEGCLRAQGHEGTDPLFAGVNALVLEHFTIGLLSELRQQVRYEQAATFDEAAEVAENKEVNMEEVPWSTMQSMVKTVQFSTEPELPKTSRSEFSHGVSHGTNDQSNERAKPPSTAAKD